MTFKKRVYINTFLFSLLLSWLLPSQNSPEDYIKIVETTSDKEEKFNALDSIIFSLKWRDDLEKYADFTDTYIDLAIEKEHYKEAIHAATTAFNVINSKLGQPERGLAMLNRVEAYKNKTDDTFVVGSIYLKKGGGYFNGKDFSKAIENYSKASEIFKEKDSIFEADAIFFRGQAQFSSGNYVEAIKDFDLASKYYENLDDLQYMFFTQASIISTYGVNGFNEKTIEERNKFIEKKMAMNHFDGLAMDYYNQSLNYGKLNNKKAQEECLLKAIGFLNSGESDIYNKGHYIVIYSKLADFYTDNGDIQKAKSYLDKAEDVAKFFKEFTQYHMSLDHTKAKYLFLTGSIDKAEEIALSNLEEIQKLGRTSHIIDARDLLYNISYAKKDYKKALEHFEAKTKFNDSIFNNEKTNAFSYYQSLYETERKEKEIVSQDANIKILEQDKAIATAKTNTLITLLIALVLIAFIVFYILRLRASKLKEKIKFHKKELTVYTEELLKKSQEHDILNKELLNLKTVQVAEDKLDRLQDLVSSKILTADDWKQFKLKFEKVYPNFLIKARLNYSLTNAEERLLTLEKLNLKTLEIADILGVSSESVIKNRYRLRKKLGLSKEISLADLVEV